MDSALLRTGVSAFSDTLPIVCYLPIAIVVSRIFEIVSLESIFFCTLALLVLATYSSVFMTVACRLTSRLWLVVLAVNGIVAYGRYRNLADLVACIDEMVASGYAFDTISFVLLRSMLLFVSLCSFVKLPKLCATVLKVVSGACHCLILWYFSDQVTQSKVFGHVASFLTNVLMLHLAAVEWSVVFTKVSKIVKDTVRGDISSSFKFIADLFISSVDGDHFGVVRAMHNLSTKCGIVSDAITAVSGIVSWFSAPSSFGVREVFGVIRGARNVDDCISNIINKNVCVIAFGLLLQTPLTCFCAHTLFYGDVMRSSAVSISIAALFMTVELVTLGLVWYRTGHVSACYGANIVVIPNLYSDFKATLASAPAKATSWFRFW